MGAMEGKYPSSPARLTRADTAQICGAIKVPAHMQTTFKSKKTAKTLVCFKKYAERHVQIKSRLCNKKLVTLPLSFIVSVQVFFHCLQYPFDTLFFCQDVKYGRFSFPNYNLMIQIACERYGFEEYRRWYPINTKNRNRISQYCDMYYQMFSYLQWQPTPLILKYTSFVTQDPQPFVRSPPVLQML